MKGAEELGIEEDFPEPEVLVRSSRPEIRRPQGYIN
jgi:hypothetical protein